MGFPGSRSKETRVWLLRSDEARFGEAIATVFPTATWRCRHGNRLDREPDHMFEGVLDALECGGGVHAFLPLPVPGEPGMRGIPAVQLLRSDLRHNEQGRYFRIGRVAIRWFEPDLSPVMHQLVTRQTNEVWRALRSVTSPAHVVRMLDGKEVAGRRIGPDALRLVQAEGLPLSDWTDAVMYRPA